jgi:hypothetical protein
MKKPLEGRQPSSAAHSIAVALSINITAFRDLSQGATLQAVQYEHLVRHGDGGAIQRCDGC